MQPLQRHETTNLPNPAPRQLSRIMVLDDDTIDQMMCTRVISRTSVCEDVVNFTTPAAALSYLSNPDSPPIDLVLLDVNMPRMNGFEFLEAAQKLITMPDLPPVVIMLSVPLGPAHSEQAKKFNVIRAYVNKPLSPLDLELAVMSF